MVAQEAGKADAPVGQQRREALERGCGGADGGVRGGQLPDALGCEVVGEGVEPCFGKAGGCGLAHAGGGVGDGFVHEGGHQRVHGKGRAARGRGEEEERCFRWQVGEAVAGEVVLVQEEGGGGIRVEGIAFGHGARGGMGLHRQGAAVAGKARGAEAATGVLGDVVGRGGIGLAGRVQTAHPAP